MAVFNYRHFFHDSFSSARRTVRFHRLSPALFWFDGLSGQLVFLLLTVSSVQGQIPRHGLAPLIHEWSVEAGGAFNQTPLIRGAAVLAIPHKGPLVVLRLKDGKLLWKSNARAGLWDRSLAADDSRVYAGTRDKGIAAFDLKSGKKVWRTTLGIQVQVRPLLANGRLYAASTHVGTDIPSHPERRARLFALDPADGSILWSHESPGYALQTPFMRNGALYLAGSYYDPTIDIDEGGPMLVEALDAVNGRRRWIYRGVDGFVKSVYASDSEVVYIGYQDFVNGIDAETGTHLWRRDTGNWVPALTGSGRFFYFGSATTVVYARHTRDGTAIWEYNIPWGSFNYLLGTPVLYEGRMVFLTQRGQVLSLNLATGEPFWYAETGLSARSGLAYDHPWLVIGDMHGGLHAYQIPLAHR